MVSWALEVDRGLAHHDGNALGMEVGVEVENVVPCVAEQVDSLPEDTGDGRMRPDNPVVGEDGNAQRPAEGLVVLVLSPGYGGAPRVVVPRARVDNRLHGQPDGRQTAGKRANRRRDVFLAVLRDGDAPVWQAGALNRQSRT